MLTANDRAGQPVSTLVTRMVPDEKAAQFEVLLREVIDVARGLEGHLGVDVLRPRGGGVYQIVFRYRTGPEHDAFMTSGRRLALVARIDELLDDETEAQLRTVDGWEGWFVTAAYAPPAVPRRWKMAVLTVGAIYPTVLVLLAALGALTAGWPLALRLLLITCVSVALMTWVVMPALTARLGRWLRS